MNPPSRLKRVLERLLSWLLDGRRASYGLAIMRIACGAITLAILLLSAPHLSYTFGRASLWGEARTSVSSAREFFWPLPFPFDRGDPDAVLYLKVGLLAVVAIAYALGWRMRIISPLFVYLWLGFSTLNPAITNSGHYQTFRIMVIIMLFADLSRRWSLDARRRTRREGRDADIGRSAWGVPVWFTNLLNNVAVILIGFQLCIIYLVSALWKIQGETWISGIAVYYPLRIEELTVLPWLNAIVWQITPMVLIASWLSIYLQLAFPFMLLHRWTRVIGLIGITSMHAGIGILLALPWFSLLMIAGDMIFVREQTWVKARAVGWGQLRRRGRRNGTGDSGQSISENVVADLS